MPPPHPPQKKRKREEIKNDNFVLYNGLAEPACLAALRSAAACVSGIVLEAGVQKQQGAEDKQAIRDSLNTATEASAAEGCEDPRSNRPINTPPRTLPYQLEQASVSRTTPRRRLPAKSCAARPGRATARFPIAPPRFRSGADWLAKEPRGCTEGDNVGVGKLLQAGPEVSAGHFSGHFIMSSRSTVLLTQPITTKKSKGHQTQNSRPLPGQESGSR